MKNTLISILALVIITLTSCNSNVKCENCITGKLIDMSSLDGCTWLIELENGERLNPINIFEFDLEKTDGLKVYLKYEKVDNIATICMSGKAVKLFCIILL